MSRLRKRHPSDLPQSMLSYRAILPAFDADISDSEPVGTELGELRLSFTSEGSSDPEISHGLGAPRERRRNKKRLRQQLWVIKLIGAFLVILIFHWFARPGTHSDEADGEYKTGPGVPGGTRSSDPPLLGHALAGPVATLNYTTYQGTWQSNGIAQFIGMRYAAAPVGDFRWRAPRNPPKLSGVRKADRWGKTCYATAIVADSSHSEDCLFVNVWTPSKVTTATKLPVLVFIQGGGYNSNSVPDNRGNEIVAMSGYNMVVVTVNYRVSIFGFLAGQAVQDDGDLNVGLLDQRKALEWIQQNIDKFGGDPAQVTLYGHSAGAGSVAYHLTAPASPTPLFSKAIIQSLFVPTQLTVDQSEWQFNSILEAAGCSGGTSQMTCLRNVDAAVLQSKVNIPRAYPEREWRPIFYWTPVTDGEYVKGDLMEMFRQGSYVKVPIILGTVENEGSIFGTESRDQAIFIQFLANNFPLWNSTYNTTLTTLYPLLPSIPFHAPWYPTASLAYGDGIFNCPTESLTAILTRDLSTLSPRLPVYRYRYNVTDPVQLSQGLGVPHAADLPAVFGPGCTGSPQSYYTTNAPMVDLIMKYWISFVRVGDPNELRKKGAEVWSEFGETGERIVFELGNVRSESIDTLFKGVCDKWNELLVPRPDAKMET